MSRLESIADEILDLVAENRSLRAEVNDLRKYKSMYFEELEAGRKHGEVMIAGMLDLCLVPGVMKAVEDNRP